MESPEAVIPISFITWSIVWNLNLIICDLQTQNFTRGLCCTLTVRGTGVASFTMKLTFYSYNTINPRKNESLCSPSNIHLITSALFYLTLFNWKVNTMLHLKKVGQKWGRSIFWILTPGCCYHNSSTFLRKFPNKNAIQYDFDWIWLSVSFQGRVKYCYINPETLILRFLISISLFPKMVSIRPTKPWPVTHNHIYLIDTAHSH